MYLISAATRWTIGNLVLLTCMMIYPRTASASMFKYEPASGSYWYSSRAENDILLEWKSDNTITTHRAPFTNLSYPETKIPFADDERILTKFHGTFAVWYKYRTFFQRQNGVMVRNDFFDQHQDLGCTDGPTGNCMVYPIDLPNVGPGVAIFQGDLPPLIWIENQGNYRAATAIEREIFTSNFDNVWISPTGTYGVGVNEGEESIRVALLKDGAQFNHDIPTAIENTYSNVELITVNNKHYLYITYSSNGAGGDKKTAAPLFRLYIIDINGTEIASRILLQTETGGNYRPTAVALSESDLTVSTGNAVVNFPLNGGSAQTLFVCDQYLPLNEPVATETEYSTTANCNNTFLSIRAGIIAQQIEFPFNIASADYVDDYLGEKLVMAVSKTKEIELVFADQHRQSQRYGTSIADPYLLKTWTENGIVCGTTEANQAHTQLCKNFSGQWESRRSAFGTITDVNRLSGKWWLVSTENTIASVFQLQTADSGIESWVLIGTVPAISGKNPLFVSNASHTPALDTGGNFTYMLEGSSFVERYQRVRPVTAFDTFNPVIDSEGRLYDFGTIQDYMGHIFYYQLDGTAVDTESETYTYSNRNQALKRGVLIQDYIVFRAEKHISLIELYGELRYGFSAYPLEDNTRAFYFQAAQTTSGYPELYTYDGIRFEQINGSKLEGKTSASSPTRVPRPKLPKNLEKKGNDGTPVTASRRITYKDKMGVWYGLGGGEMFRSGASLEELIASSFSTNDDNYFLDAISEGNQILALNYNGIWSCPSDAATPINDQTFDIPVSVGCQMKRFATGIRKMASHQGRYIILQGQVLLLLSSLVDQNPTVLSQSPTVSTFSIDGDQLYWTEPGKTFIYDLNLDTTAIKSSTLDLENAQFHAGWTCNKQGLFWDNGTAPVQIRPSCDFLTATNSGVNIISEGRLLNCNAGQCSDEAILPLPWRKDCALGGFSNNETHTTLAAFASQLYRIEAGHNTMTPLPIQMGDGKNAVFAPITRINDDFILTKGGGLIRLDGDQGEFKASILRIQ